VSEMPSGWVQAPLKQVATSQLGRMLSANRETGVHPKPYLRNRDVQWGHINVDELPVMDFGPHDAARFLLRPGDVLVCEGGEVGRAAIWRGQLTECYYQKALHRVRTSAALLPEFLLYLLEHCARTRAFERYTSGSTIAHLPQEDLRNLPVPIPPAAEQERIVAAVEEQFSRLDAAVAALERARQNLKRMRAAVLQVAVADALGCTNQRMTPLADLLSVPLANGRSVPDGSGFPVLRLTAVRNGWIDVGCSKKGAWTAAEAQPYAIRKGDYLVVRGNGSKHLVGRGAMVGVDSEVAYPDTLIRLRFDETVVVARYASLMWNSRTVRNQIESAARTTAGIYKINQKDLGRITFPVPSIEDQMRIYASADSLLYALSALEVQLNAELQRSTGLRSAILTAAFSGKLVPQDSADEAASALLERIAAERASSNGNNRTRTRKPRTPREKVTV
jgi:type I restriction enzyme, S subunit